MRSPRLTIGLITYNGARHIERSLESLLAQRFSDFKLLIFDNASEDGTSAICARVAAADPRVVHHRHPKTIPQSANFEAALAAAETEYFMWATDDDLWLEDFAEGCITHLDATQEAVSACTKVIFRDEAGRSTAARSTFTVRGTVRERLASYLANPRDNARLYGVYRTSALRQSYPSGICSFGYDWIIVALTLLQGAHIEVPTTSLVRTANAPGKYFGSFGRHFAGPSGLQGRLERLLPLLSTTLELRRRLPRAVWRHVFWKLVRLNLHQALLLIRWKIPSFEPIFVSLRRLDRALGNS
ncbi:MAG: glycosyltransferase family A protein [Pseudomonadota bacterium]